jgi:hypothetical protein
LLAAEYSFWNQVNPLIIPQIIVGAPIAIDSELTLKTKVKKMLVLPDTRMSK